MPVTPATAVNIARGALQKIAAIDERYVIPDAVKKEDPARAADIIATCLPDIKALGAYFKASPDITLTLGDKWKEAKRRVEEALQTTVETGHVLPLAKSFEQAFRLVTQAGKTKSQAVETASDSPLAASKPGTLRWSANTAGDASSPLIIDPQRKVVWALCEDFNDWQYKPGMDNRPKRLHAFSVEDGTLVTPDPLCNIRLNGVKRFDLLPAENALILVGHHFSINRITDGKFLRKQDSYPKTFDPAHGSITWQDDGSLQHNRLDGTVVPVKTTLSIPQNTDITACQFSPDGETVIVALREQQPWRRQDRKPDPLFAGTFAINLKSGNVDWSSEAIGFAGIDPSGRYLLGDFLRNLKALDVKNGAPKWTSEMKSPLGFDPQTNTLFALRSGKVVALELESGAERWAAETNIKRELKGELNPAYSVMGRWYFNNPFAFDPQTQTLFAAGSPKASSDNSILYAIDTTNGTIKWTVELFPLFYQPVFDPGTKTVYVVGEGDPKKMKTEFGKVYAIQT